MAIPLKPGLYTPAVLEAALTLLLRIFRETEGYGYLLPETDAALEAFLVAHVAFDALDTDPEAP